jgi:hypothetical protein
MAKNEAFKAVCRKGNEEHSRVWSWLVEGPCAVPYSTLYWTKPKGEWLPKGGTRLSVFSSLRAAKQFVHDADPEGTDDEIWRCMYRGKSQKERFPAGTLRVTSVKLIKRIWPEDGSE